jgi:hypothetical protein
VDSYQQPPLGRKHNGNERGNLSVIQEPKCALMPIIQLVPRPILPLVEFVAYRFVKQVQDMKLDESMSEVEGQTPSRNSIMAFPCSSAVRCLVTSPCRHQYVMW